MAAFLDWFASHNTLVIQSLAAIVAMLIVFLIFRLLFTNQEVAAAGMATNVTYAQLEEKLNKLLEQQSMMKVSVIAATEAPADVLGADAMAALSGEPAGAVANVAVAASTTEQIAELSRLRAEITSLKDSLARKESEITTAKEQAAQSANTPQQGANLADLSGKISEYESEIETLKNRLSDYEIIAEDIADLQRYKKENQDLKNQLANQPQAVAEPAEAPAAEVEAMPDLTTEEVAAGEEASAEAMPELTVEEAPVDPNAMPEPIPTAELDTQEALEVSKDVKKEEKVLLDEFEKHFAKDDD
jgi:regulator of replication initiation timing